METAPHPTIDSSHRIHRLLLAIVHRTPPSPVVVVVVVGATEPLALVGEPERSDFVPQDMEEASREFTLRGIQTFKVTS